jgi:hypothetical protein
MDSNNIEKEFILKKEIMEQLEELAKIRGESSSKVMEELIEDRYYTLVNKEALSKGSNNEFLEIEKVVENLGKINV